MRVLVVGSGGREHALVWKLSQSSGISRIFCAPGNAGIAREATCVPIEAADIEGLLSFSIRERIDLVVVGPEVPLVNGIVNLFEKSGIPIFGPTKEAALLEGSKSFTKEFCLRHDIPTANASSFDDIDKARNFLAAAKFPLVVKADGLAAGKGVVICKTTEDALNAINKMMKEKLFDRAGERVLIEDFLAGEEASFMAISDGRNLLPLASSQDHKRIFDDDKGANTGGMGAYSPAPVVTKKVSDFVMEKIMYPTVNGLAKEGKRFVGVLYAGLMIDKGQAKLLEFNCRFGDPETQPIMMRFDSDLLDIIMAAVSGKLNNTTPKWKDDYSVCVVLSSGGYPGEYENGEIINGLDEAGGLDGVKVFHSGTVIKGEKFVTNGGRVLGVAALGSKISQAISNVYSAVDKISWDGMHYRKDIGRKAI